MKITFNSQGELTVSGSFEDVMDLINHAQHDAFKSVGCEARAKVYSDLFDAGNNLERPKEKPAFITGAEERRYNHQMDTFHKKPAPRQYRPETRQNTDSLF